MVALKQHPFCSSTAGYACAMLVCLLGACSSHLTAPEVQSRLVGAWEHVDAAGKKKQPEKGPFDFMEKLYVSSPHPDKLVFHSDGTFEAIYSEKQIEALRRYVKSQHLTRTQRGTYHVSVDWSGLAWIKMAEATPPRRVTVDRGHLILHKTEDGWTPEKYVRSQ